MKFQSLDPNSDFGARPIIIIKEITTSEDKKGSENMGEFSDTTISKVVSILLNQIDVYMSIEFSNKNYII